MSEFNKDELSLLLYLETCSVDYGGSVEGRRMNVDDFAIAKRWNDEGFIRFGRIYSKDVKRVAISGRIATNWVELSEDAWKAAHVERRARNQRISDKRRWLKAEENSRRGAA